MPATQTKTKKRQPTSIDKSIAIRLRRRRNIVGLSQEKLAEKVDLTFQQIQKYETASNRISAGMLFEIAKVLKVPVSYFYEDAENSCSYEFDTDIEYQLTKPHVTSLIRKYVILSDYNPKIVKTIHDIFDSFLKANNLKFQN